MPRRLTARPRPLPGTLAELRANADQALRRTAGAPLVGGNSLRILKDAAENYPAWEEAIEAAQSTIHVEMYIFHRDAVGRRFVDLLANRARQGVTVRVCYDWWGCGFGPAMGLFKPLIAAGGEVRPFNPPTFTTALGWVRRNHRKLITVDGQTAFISGLCLGDMWMGDSTRDKAPWRDTGVAITGPAVAHAEASFAESWALCGGRIDPDSLPDAQAIAPTGDVSLRIVPTQPFTASMLRLDLLIATLARETLWITDAYFLDHGPYLEALHRAAKDGVDVRLLLPRDSDLGWSVPASRTLYRTMLESGVRVFEWNGPMIHAKTAVADGRWTRIGSTNLNINSWLGNWELDVAVEDQRVAGQMAEAFLEDLSQSTEIILVGRRRSRNRAPARAAARARGSARRVVRSVSSAGRSLGAAVMGSRPLSDYEIFPLIAGGLLLVALAVGVYLVPEVLMWPVVVVATWTGIGLLIEAIRLWRNQPL